MNRPEPPPAPREAAAPSDDEGAPASRLSDWVFTKDPRQRLRLGQTALANVIMVGCVLLLHAGADAQGPLHHWIWPWTALALGGMVAVFAVVRSGISLRWRDPSIAMFQMLFATACGAMAYVLAGPVRSAALPIMAVVLMFGMFGLTVRQLIVAAALTLLWFGAAGLYWVVHSGGDPQVITVEKINFGMLLLMLSGVCILTARLARLRERARRHKAELEAALEQNRLLATQDALTGCLNRRAMMGRLAQALSMSARFGTPCSVIMIDLDHFKRINDVHGHAAGDEVLRAVAELARGSLREVDALSRWGGEEFLVLLPSTAAAEAVACAERLQARVSGMRLTQLPNDLSLSFSAGVAAFKGADEPLPALIDRADRAMYRAKQAGRAQVVCAQQE
ncbi:GGDEF domain-containing protein [Ideonella sp. DXS29W]|uniref:diguanylate cyclase n=1 Tax=Ideonella lacteola TaxID=2984193 RepID=A0ABU9BMJ8_9BURK